MSGKICIYILSFLLLSGSVIADTKTQPDSTKQQQDFGKGFAMLFQMGLPRLEGARPALVSIRKGGPLFYNYGLPEFVHYYSVSYYTICCWIKVPDNSTKPETCIIGGVFKYKLFNHTEKWETITPAEMAKYIKEFLQNKDNANVFLDDSSKYGLLLLQAAQLYESGAKFEANEIAELLFKADGSKNVLQAATNVLADAKYLRAYCDLIESKDWKKFNEDLEKIIGRFNNEWENVRYAKAVQAAVASRVKTPEPPDLKTLIPLSADDRELIKQLSLINGRDYYQSELIYECWLSDVENTDKDQKGLNALDKIKARGINSVPLLIAMLDDEWLMPFFDKNRFGHRRYRNDKENKEKEKALEKNHEANLAEAADYLDVPMTRGMLARQLLEPLIMPENKEQEIAFEKNSKDFKAQCVAWYESIKKYDSKSLQKKYLITGYELQKRNALENMIAVADDSTAPLIEYMLLDCNMLSKNLLTQYCNIRKDKAKPFIEKLGLKYYTIMNEEPYTGAQQVKIKSQIQKQ